MQPAAHPCSNEEIMQHMGFCDCDTRQCMLSLLVPIILSRMS